MTSVTPGTAGPAGPVAGSHPVEAKVKASTITAGTVAAVLLVILSAVQSSQIIHGVPDWVPVVIGAAVTALGTFTGGYQAPHTPRS
jgi:hypothetical protein